VLLGLNETGTPFESTAWWAATSDVSGVYRFDGLPAGPFILIAAKNGYAGWASIPSGAPAPMVLGRSFPALALAATAPRLSIDLVLGGRAPEANLTLHRPASISGRLMRPDGSPDLKEGVVLYTADEAGALAIIRGMLTEANGSYAFGDLPPAVYYLGRSQTGLRLQDIDRAALTSVTVTEGVVVRNADVSIGTDGAFSITGRIVDTSGPVPRALQIEYGVPGATHRGLLSTLSPDGRFQIRDRAIVPGPLTIVGRGENDDGPLIGVLTLIAIDGPNDVEVIVGAPGGVRGRVSMDGGAVPAVGAVRLALVRDGFTPLGASDDVIEVAPDGWFEAGNLIGDYRVRVAEPRGWTVKAVRREGRRVATDRLAIRNAEILEEVEILLGPR
jgi:hypothetical protein